MTLTLNGILRFFLLPSLALTTALSMQAAVIYDFEGTNFLGTEIRFSYTAPNFVQVDGPLILAAELSACTIQGDSCSAIQMLPSGPGDPSGYPQLDILDSFGLTSSFYFPYDSFVNGGVYQAIYEFSPGTLSVTPIPEPATFGMLALTVGSGVLTIGWRRRKILCGLVGRD